MEKFDLNSEIGKYCNFEKNNWKTRTKSCVLSFVFYTSKLSMVYLASCVVQYSIMYYWCSQSTHVLSANVLEVTDVKTILRL